MLSEVCITRNLSAFASALVILLSCFSTAHAEEASVKETADDAFENNLRRKTNITEPGKSANAWEPYVEDLEKRIKQVWKPQTVGEPIGCMLNLMLNPNGSIRKAGIQNSSKDAEFDTAALKAMVAASPFPSLFDENLDQLYLHVSFRNRSNGNDCKAFIFLPSGYKEAQPELSKASSSNAKSNKNIESSQWVTTDTNQIQAEKRQYQFWFVDTQRRIKQAWFPPKGTPPVKVMFEVDRDGTLTIVQARTLADDVSTRKAVAAIKAAAPYKLPRGSEEHATFEFNYDRKLLESGENAITKFRTTALSMSNSEANKLASNEESENQAPQEIAEFYKAVVQRKIKRAWFLHEDFGSREVVLQLKLQSDGSIAGLKINRSSNLKFADQLALATVRAEAPFPPFPTGMPSSMNLFITLETTARAE